jgi:hypothetical protein
MFKSVAPWLIKQKVVKSLNVADTFHCSFVIFQRNLSAKCLFYPNCLIYLISARAEQFRKAGHWTVSIAATLEQPFPFRYCWTISEVLTVALTDQTVRWMVEQFLVIQLGFCSSTREVADCKV